jgi:ribosomal protein S18 acetylase RimI-like enzyme
VTEIRVVWAADTAPLRQQVLRPYLTVEQVVEESDDAPSIAVYDGERVVACASVREEPMPDDPRAGDWRLRGMASAPDVRGQGHGAAALTYALDYARERGGQRVWCNARKGAVGFYERYGFTTIGEEFDVGVIGPHYLMARSTSGST